MNTLKGKVALITGAGRGQGRSHAVTLAKAGADLILIDICADIATVPYPLASEADLAETAALVEAEGRRCVKNIVDVRDYDGMLAAVKDSVAHLGHLDIVVANAGIITFGPMSSTPQEIFQTTIDVNLTGVWNTLEASVPHLLANDNGGSIVVIGSTNSTSGKTLEQTPGSQAYIASKHAVIGLMRSYALHLGPKNIRVNAIEPTSVITPLITNDAAKKLIEQAEPRHYDLSNLQDVWAIEPEDISAAVEWLVSDSARYVTGIELPVDAGYGVK